MWPPHDGRPSRRRTMFLRRLVTGLLQACCGAEALLHDLSGSGVLSGLLRDGGDGGQFDARRRVARLPLGMG